MKVERKIRTLTRVYELMTLNFFMVLTKKGNCEVKDFAALSSSGIENSDLKTLACGCTLCFERIIFCLTGSALSLSTKLVNG